MCSIQIVTIRRRDFIRVAAGVASDSWLAGVNFVFAEKVSSRGQSEQLEPAEFIWSDFVPVPLLRGGQADKIASSANGKKSEAADFHCVFTKLFRVAGAHSTGRVHIMAYTRYRLYVNGQYVNRGPSRFQNQWPEYDTCEVSSFLREGENRIHILAHRDAPTGRIMHHAPGMAAVVEWTDTERTHRLSTDSSWLSTPELSFGPRNEAWASIEEYIDAHKMPDWLSQDADYSTWKRSVLAPMNDQIKVHPRSTPLQMEQDCVIAGATFPFSLYANQEVALSIPRIVQGFHTFHMEAEEGSLLELSYELPDGEVTGRCSYICRSGSQTYMGGDTFAFRQLKVRLLHGRVNFDKVAITEVRYPFERVASFECSDTFYSKVWGMCARTLEILSEDAYVDCADRERVEWTDCSPPAFDCTRVMMRGPRTETNMCWGDSRLLKGLLKRISLTQLPDGQMKAHSCSERFDIHAVMEDRTCDWVALLREYYESSGDAKFVEEMWPSLLRLLRWYRTRLTTNELVMAREWEVWDNPLRYVVCEGTGLNAMYFRALRDAGYLASVIGRIKDRRDLKIQSDRLRAAFDRSLWDESAGAYGGALIGPGATLPIKSAAQIRAKIVDLRYPPTVQANLFALYAGFVPEHKVDSTRRWVLSNLDQVLGPMSYYYLFRMLYEMESPETDRQVLNLIKTAWRKQVDSSWGTTWEDLEDKGGSKLHIYGVVPGYYLTAYILGARRVGTVLERKILIEPRTSGLTFAHGACVTEYGLVKIEWERSEEGDLTLSCDLPANVSTELKLYYQDDKILYINGDPAKVNRQGPFITAQLHQRHNQISFRSSRSYS